jgi:hypothetical protein
VESAEKLDLQHLGETEVLSTGSGGVEKMETNQSEKRYRYIVL